MSAAICTIHCMIRARVESLLGDERSERDKAALTEIVELVAEAMERGQAMEDRLTKYREGIEKLGFARKR